MQTPIWEEFLGMPSLPGPTGDHFLPTTLLKNSKHLSPNQGEKTEQNKTTLRNTVKSASITHPSCKEALQGCCCPSEPGAPGFAWGWGSTGFESCIAVRCGAEVGGGIRQRPQLWFDNNFLNTFPLLLLEFCLASITPWDILTLLWHRA